MLSLPVSMIVGLILVFLLLRSRFKEGRFYPLTLFIGLCALQSVIIALAQHYGIYWFRLVQPLTASLLPPLAWLTFCYTALRARMALDVLHLTGPVCALISLVYMPAFLDILIPFLFCIYGLAILLICQGGADALPHLRLGGGKIPSRIWIIMSLLIMVSGIVDMLITFSLHSGAAWVPPLLVSVFSALNLLFIGVFGLRPELISGSTESPSVFMLSEEDVHEIMEKLNEIMVSERPYLDPDLTLNRLARKTGVPAKTLSAAINRSTGQSVSRLVNAARIKFAQAHLIQGNTVTDSMLQSGFYTKSNFNREFLRVAGKSPTNWLKTQNIDPN